MSGPSSEALADEIGANLPFLRRYSRALTGSQTSGDRYAIATLETILSDRDAYQRALGPKVALFRAFHVIWTSTGAPVDTASEDTGLASVAHRHLAGLTPNTREALLLSTIEEFSLAEVASIMEIEDDEAAELVEIAHTEMSRSTSGKIMIIEDEAIISMDLEAIVTEMGHRVTGIARTEDKAIDLAGREQPDLILSDIQLADDSSGIDAVGRILSKHGDIPVIFITAFPERLLTGERREPVYLISKPYTEEQVRSAVSQAMFFSSTETLHA
ncbi:response regulator [Poseidonocella pacifica]|nr:response regulator [Poseidonocella pacifica]